MAKIGESHKTHAFGEAAERFCSRLYGMDMHYSGDNRPDLLSPVSYRGKPFSVEVKSGAGRVSLVKAQLSYGINNVDTCRRVLGRHARRALKPVASQTEFADEGRETFYAIVNRIDGLRAKDLVGDFSTIRLKWGDQFVLPSEVVFYYFAAAASTHSGMKMGPTLDCLRRGVARNIRDQSSHYEDRCNGYWQGLPVSSARALFEGSADPVNREIQRGTLDKCFRFLRNKTSFDDFKREVVSLPGGSQLHVLYDPTDKKSAKSLASNVKSNRAKLEHILAEREEMVNVLGEKNFGWRSFEQFYNGNLSVDRRRKLEREGYEPEFIDELERLVVFMDKEEFVGEKNLRQIPF